MRDVIIIGAGLAGSSLAAALAHRGWDVLLVERKELPRHKVCGEFLSPDALGSLQRLGLYDRVARLGPSRMQAARLVSGRGLSLRLALPAEAWGVSRYHLDTTLLTAALLSGVTVRTGVSASHIRPGHKVFRVAVDGGWEPCRAVIGAWGRQTLPGLRAHHPPPAARAWVGVKRHYEGVDAGSEVELYFVSGGYVGLAPVEGGRLNCSALVSQPSFLAAGGRPDPFMQEACRQNPALATRLAGARPIGGGELTTSGVDTGRLPIPWCPAGWPLLGDASTLIPPLVGDGMAMAFRSAELTLPLVERFLLGDLSLQEWEAGYRRAYRREFTRRIHLARLVQSWLVRPWASDGLILLGHLLPSLAAQLLHATRGPLRQDHVLPR